MTKICVECKESKEETEFYKDAASPGGVRKNCKVCKNKKTILWREANRERYNEIARQNNHKHYEKDRLRRYNITPAEHNSARQQQDNKCAICNTVNKSKKRDFATDHDHITNKFRALLCYKCNRDMNVVDDPEQLARCIAYKQKYS